MKLLSKLALINFFCLTAFPVTADTSYDDAFSQQTSNNTQNVVQYLLNLGGFLGYDLTQSPTANNQSISQQLLSLSTTQLIENYAFNTFLGAIPVDAVSSSLAQIVPNNLPGSSIINALANATYIYQNYNTASNSQGTVSVSPLIDQQTYQQDPVSQAVLNILGTPDSSYCMSYDQSTWTNNCTLLYDNQIMSNILGPIPSTYQFYTYTYNQQLISQLNSNSLTGPLQYSTTSSQAPGTGSPTPNSQNPGLTADNQLQQASNFIRYASGAVTPMALPSLKEYDSLYNLAVPPRGNNVSQLQQMKAQSTLSNYLTNLRVYAAQSSVGMSNLYYILSKRLPQNQSGNNPILTSQSLSEFNMATWRLFNPDQSQNQQWINQINTASPATVEKEIATLLAEMNYQMYLDRQIQERILLTNTILLLQNTKAAQPSADFAEQGSGQ